MKNYFSIIRKIILPPIVILVLFMILIGFMLIIGLLIKEVLADTQSEIYRRLALIVILAWMALMIAYYAWLIYFYNYNYGKSSGFWRKFIEMSKADGRKTEARLYKELAAPNKNPFFDQTFGLPPGTVRGTLALTVMIGGLCLLILAIGGSDLFNQAAFQRQLNFFEQAFLMVIAFYFGTKGFEILQQEQTKRTKVLESNPAVSKQSRSVQAEEDIYAEEDIDAEVPSSAAENIPEAQVSAPIKTQVAHAITPIEPMKTNLTLSTAAPITKTPIIINEEIQKKNLNVFYPHVKDLEEEVTLQDEDIHQFAKNWELEVPAVRAVIEIESSGKGFLKDGRPKILFEGHVFWRRLKNYRLDPVPLSKSHPSIIYPTWTRRFYLTGTLEYKRLNEAKAIHDSAALESASWGMFQIMGHHYRHMGYKTVQEFVKKQEKSEKEHLEAFGLFISKVSPPCYDALKTHNWATFARHYNGPQYAKNQYDIKLQNSYNKFIKQS